MAALTFNKSTVEMILRMAGATLMYVAITALLWAFWRKKESHGMGLQVLIGLIYGACSVAANHIGITYFTMVLNVRDIGPLAAGLFFSPVSGILAGVIGGIERIIAGQIWDIGEFTSWACGISTITAGLLSAVMNRWVYYGKRPSVIHAFFLGAVMEVFHMYSVLFTNRETIYAANYIVRTVLVPMVLFTAVGVSACSWVVRKISGEPSDLGWRMQQEDIPISVHFQRWLLAVTLAVFALNFWISYNLQTRLALESASLDLMYRETIYIARYQEKNEDLDTLKSMLEAESTSCRYYVFDAVNGEVFFSTASFVKTGIGVIPAKDREEYRKTADNENHLYVTTELDGISGVYTAGWLDSEKILLVLYPSDLLYEDRANHLYESTLADILLFTVLYMLISRLVEFLVVKNLNRVNRSLNRITNGNLDETVWVYTSSEFKALSTDINKTVTALKGYINEAKERMKEELEMATIIQDSSLPKNFNLPTHRIELYALMTPAKEVGGDFYDFFYIGRDQLALVIADVSGKGVPAALFMMRAKTAIKNYARSRESAAELLQHVNNVLCEGNDPDMFVTVWLGILDLGTGKMRCANAGHEYPVLMRAGGDYELLKEYHGLVLAVMEDMPQKEYEIQLNPGDRLLVYTDGVPEAVNQYGEAYGTDRLVARLNTLKNVPQKRVLESVRQDIRTFAGSAEQFDDITLMGITYISGTEQED